MAVNLNDAEYFADTIMSRVEQMLNEREILRRELSRKSDGTLEQDKAFVSHIRIMLRITPPPPRK